MVDSFGVDSHPDGLLEAEVSEVSSLAELGSLRTVLATVAGGQPRDGAAFTVAELADIFERPDGGNARDQDAFRHFLGLAADAAYQPTLLLEPTSTGWWMLDGIHRAAALFSARRVAGRAELRLPVFVLPRPLV